MVIKGQEDQTDSDRLSLIDRLPAEETVSPHPQKDPVLVTVKLASEEDDGMDSHTGIKKRAEIGLANRGIGYLDNNRSRWDVLWGSTDFIKLLQPVKMNDAVDQRNVGLAAL